MTVNGVRYVLTRRGGEWLDTSVYPAEESLAPYRERCELLCAVAAATLPRPAALGDELAAVGERLDAHRRELAAEDDLLGHLFETTFKEPL